MKMTRRKFFLSSAFSLIAAPALATGRLSPKLALSPTSPRSLASSRVSWKSAPHNAWKAASQVILNGHGYYPESPEKFYADNGHHSIDISTNTTSPIVRCEVRNGDLWSGALGGNDTERAELSSVPPLYPKGSQIWLSAQFIVEPGEMQICAAGGFPGGPAAWCSLFQILGDGREALAPWHLSFLYDYSAKIERFHVKTQTMPGQRETILWSSPGPAVRGMVHRIVANLVITGDNRGSCMVWLDGVQVCNAAGIAIGAGDKNNYVKFGVYRGWQNNGLPPMAVRYANVEHGSSSLKSRVTNPLPWPAPK